MVLVFQNVAQGILITTKSYLLRTVMLSLFFFLILPVGKILLIKLGLLSLSPAVLSRAGHHGGGGEDPYDIPALQTVHGFIESSLWEVYAWIESFYDTSEFDDYLYA